MCATVVIETGSNGSWESWKIKELQHLNQDLENLKIPDLYIMESLENQIQGWILGSG